MPVGTTARELNATLLRVLVAGLGGGLIFLVLLGYRTDYAGHYLSGFGGTLLLLAVPLAALKGVLRWEPLGVATISILLGAITEATVFGIAAFDPVDFFNQSLGAALAAIAVCGCSAASSLSVRCAALACIFLVVGAMLAFA